MTDFNFLRIKWPKLAAIAADASRLVEVSPAAAISTMQNFCEWAADIALDLNDIKTQNGITQQEKIETLKAIGHAPTDIVGRFQNVLLAGGRRLYRQNEDVEEARTCIEDVYEIGRWLNKEADRSGWPPKSDYYRPMVSPIGMQPAEAGYTEGGGIGDRLKDFRPFLVFGVAAIVIIAVAVFLVIVVLNGGGKPTDGKPTVPHITPTPTVSATAAQVTEPGGPTATPEPGKTAFLDAMTITSTQNTVFKKAWNFHSGGSAPQLTVSDKHYANGLGMYIPSKSIQKTQGTMTITCKLNDDYDTLTFDLGADSNIGYGAGNGKFRIQIYLENTHVDAVYDSGLNEYNFTEMGVNVPIKGAHTLIIKLTEQKGTKGTVNVVMGNCLLTQGTGAGTGGDASASPAAGSGSPTLTPSPTPSPSASTAAGGGGNPDTDIPVETEQALPPG